MPLISFGNYEYVPVLGTTEIERIAYEQLQVDTRAGILPLFELTRHRGAEELEAAVAMVESTTTLPFILDLDKRYAPPPYQAQNPSNPVAEQQRVERETAENNAYNTYLNSLLSPNNGFEAWRQLCGRLPNSVPVLQYTNPAAQSNAILRQASLLAQGQQSIAIRVTQTQSAEIISLAAQVLATLPSSGQLLVILDCGQGRRAVQDKIDWVLGSLTQLSSQLEPFQIASLAAVCMSNSYPQMSHDGLRVVDNCDRQIWLEAYQQFPFHFGDYAASTRAASLSAFLPRTFRATVVHSLDHQWLVHRHENADDVSGYVDGAQVITENESFDPIDSWTDQAIVAAAGGSLSGMNAPKRWHAARIAGHIDRQFRYQAPTTDFEDVIG